MRRHADDEVNGLSMNRSIKVLIALCVLLGAAAAGVVALNLRGEEAITDAPADFISTPQLVERGRYLALAGNCAGCHTARGGAPYAGGRGIDTPFGTVYASNLTPDEATGLGRWSASAFWRAMHHGRSRAFPLISCKLGLQTPEKAF